MLRRLWHAWLMLNLPCDRISELVSRSLDERLGRVERLAYQSHLVYCSACRRYRRHLLVIREAMGHASGSVGMPEEVRDRIRKAMKDR
jgi:predicted anti-sigma-YlaC factor YlaD